MQSAILRYVWVLSFIPALTIAGQGLRTKQQNFQRIETQSIEVDGFIDDDELLTCLDNLMFADTNFDFRLERNEYADFLALESNGRVNTAFPFLDLAFVAIFYSEACTTCYEETNVDNCCVGDSAHINIEGDNPERLFGTIVYVCGTVNEQLANLYPDIFDPTASPTFLTPSPTLSPTVTNTESPTVSPSASPNVVPTASPFSSPTNEPTTNPTVLPTSTPSSSTDLPTLSGTAFPTSSLPSQTPTSVPSDIPSLQPSSTLSNAPSVLPTRSPSSVPTSAPTTSSPTVSPTDTPTRLPTITESPTSSTSSPTSEPTDEPSSIPSSVPTALPSTSPSSVPTNGPTSVPTEDPTSTPTSNPTESPSTGPTGAPSIVPSSSPTGTPTGSPSDAPTVTPTTPSPTTQIPPTANPTITFLPTSSPTDNPSAAPSSSPSAVPSVLPTSIPSGSPTPAPSASPSIEPSVTPSYLPSGFPTPTPTSQPTVRPTFAPTSQPTVDPNLLCISFSYQLNNLEGISPDDILNQNNNTLKSGLEAAGRNITIQVLNSTFPRSTLQEESEEDNDFPISRPGPGFDPNTLSHKRKRRYSNAAENDNTRNLEGYERAIELGVSSTFGHEQAQTILNSSTDIWSAKIPSLDNLRRFLAGTRPRRLVFYSDDRPNEITNVIENFICSSGFDGAICVIVQQRSCVFLEEGDDPAVVSFALRNGLRNAINDGDFVAAIPADDML